MPTYTTSDGTRLYYEADRLEAGATPVVFLNGMTQSTAHWGRQTRLFDGFATLRYDARGQGKSGLGDRPLTLEMHADDLAGLLDALEVDRAHLVGFSHGARVALGVSRWHGARIDHLVLCSQTARPTTLAQTIVRSWKEVLERGGLEAMAWSSLPAILGDAYLEANANLIEGMVRAAVQRNSADGVAALLDAMMAYPDLSELAGGVEAPTLVLSGEDDWLVERRGAEALAELTGGRHCEVAGVGHTIPIEAPEAFARIVQDFLPAPRP